MQRLFLDTNVVLDYLGRRAPFFEDAVQYSCALHAGVDCIITRDPHGFPADTLPVLTPVQYLEGRLR